MRKIIALAVCTCLFATGCTSYKYDKSLYYKGDTWDPKNSALNSAALFEDKAVYENDTTNNLSCLYLTVQYGKDEVGENLYSFDYLKAYTDSDIGDKRPYCDVIMRQGTETASSDIRYFGFGETVVNGKILIKGETKKIKNRSYEIKLYDRAGTWNGAKTINLIKSTDDLSRMRQKLCFDSVSLLPDIGGLRTGFVRLFIQDTTKNGRMEFEDYGIYTFIEQPNKSYLVNHGLDANGQLYRAKDFDFSRKKDIILNIDDANYNSKKFENALNIRESIDHKKLISMLEAVNNYDIPIEEIIKTYFNEENLLAYAAINILFSDFDAFKEDYLLYSPENSLSWYFIPQDFNDAFKVYDFNSKIPESIIGYGFLQNNVLFRRYLNDAKYIEKLKRKMKEVREKVSNDYINKKIDLYNKQILKYLFSIPEIKMLPRPAEYVEPYIASLPGMIEKNYNAFLEYSKKPLAPYILSVAKIDESFKINFVSEINTKYYAEVSSTEDFTNVLIKTEPILGDEIVLASPDGKNYLRIIAVDDRGNTQACSNITYNPLGYKSYNLVVLE